MTTSTTNLTNGGLTANFQFQYDTSEANLEPARTNQVIAACEADFALISGWFGNIGLGVTTPIAVNIIPLGLPGACSLPGACWALSSGNLTVTVSQAGVDSLTIRYLMVSELVELLMRAQASGWFGQGTEGSQGEGLSRFLATQFLVANGSSNPPAGFANSNTWLSSPRADYVNTIKPKDDGPDAVTGCSLLFIYYLFSQMNVSIQRIVAAGGNSLGKVYGNITGTSDDPFPAFARLLETYFPGTATITRGNIDNPFPLPDPPVVDKGILWHHATTGETQIWFMEERRVTQRATVIGEDGTDPALVTLPFSIVGTLDNDGDLTSDILWHHATTGETQIWSMNGRQVRQRATVLGEDGKAALVGLPYSIVGTADFDGNGQCDILWHHATTGETQIWFMAGQRVAGRATVLGEDGKPVSIGWPFGIVGAGKFDPSRPGIGSDILWYNSSTGETQIWFMERERCTGRATVIGEDGKPALVGPPFSIVGTGDFTGDGVTDIVWHNSDTGEVQLWFTKGGRVTGRATVLGEDGKAALVGLPFSIVGTGHYAAQLPWAG